MVGEDISNTDYVPLLNTDVEQGKSGECMKQDPPDLPQMQKPRSATFTYLIAKLGTTTLACACLLWPVLLMGCFWSLKFLVVLVSLSTLLCLLMNFRFWQVRLVPPTSDSKEDYYARRVTMQPHPHRLGKMCLAPIVTFKEWLDRGMAVFGMRPFLFFKDQFTVGLEFRLRVLLDFVRYDLGMGRYGQKCRELEEYPKAMYQFLMNSSMICFLDASTGNFIAYETTLPWQQHEVKTWYRIDIFPDHQLQEVRKMSLQAESGGEIVHISDMVEITTLMLEIVTYKCHGNIHWLANGVVEIGNQQWPLAEESSSISQGFNSAALFSTPPFWQISVENMAKAQFNNMTVEGFPLHADLAKYEHVCKTQRILKKCRVELESKFGKCGGEEEKLTKAQRNAILAQVVMHSADHYFADTCFPMHDYYSHTLNTSFLCGRFIVGHQPYVSRQLLCRELAQKDELCKLIYEVAKSVDEDFANEGLFVAICA